MAALLYTGPGSVITGSAALRWQGLRPPQADHVDVLVTLKRRRQSVEFVRITRSVRMPEQVCINGPVRFTMAARAVADAARSLDDLRQVRSVVADAVQRGWCRVAELAKELDEGPTHGSARLRRVLAEVADGVRSVSEGEFRDLVIGAGLPVPMFNARLYVGNKLIAVADAWWPEAGVAGEVDSREWHLSPEDWQKTLSRHARMTALGLLVLHFTPGQIRREPAQVVATIRAALEVGREQRPSQVEARPTAG
jgi:hypothetical protein